ncbi:MAG: coenzyme F420-0:L-glutamate ligase [Candidatus Bathyarchaeia archaeon]
MRASKSRQQCPKARHKATKGDGTMPSPPKIEVIGVTGIPLIQPGDDLPSLICDAVKRQGSTFEDGDILVIAQTVVSKAEGSIIRLSEIKPSIEAKIIAEQVGKDPRITEVILREARRVIRLRGPHLITETKHGWICANSAVDISNVTGGDAVTTLPEDADRSAERIRQQIRKLTGKKVAVIISDTFGRAFRIGQTNVAVGVAGIRPLLDRRGEKDLFGYTLKVKQIAVADELASAAELVIGEAAEGIPVALIRGYAFKPDEKANSKELIRPLNSDLFI